MARFKLGADGTLVQSTSEPSPEAKSELFTDSKRLGDGRYRFLDGEWIPCDGDNGLDTTKRAEGLQIIKDLEPYRPVASDVAASGKRPVIGGRRQHREFLQRNGYREVGNDFVPNQRQEMSKAERIQDIKRAMRD